MRQISPQRQIQLARLLGLLFCAAGFAAIGLGWNGMAKVTCPDCQLPYLLSGGAAGLGLIVFGVGLLVVAQIRTERARLGQYFEQLTTTIKPIPTLGSAAAGNGDGRVVAGLTTYHRTDCRLVKGKPELELVTAEAAAERGLEPCRVCNPPAAEAAGVPVPAAVDAAEETAEGTPEERSS